jgi:hypothetical protein
MGPEFWQTVMGHRFFEGDVPTIKRALIDLNDAVRDLTAAVNRLAFAEERSRTDRLKREFLDGADCSLRLKLADEPTPTRSQREKDGDPFYETT